MSDLRYVKEMLRRADMRTLTAQDDATGQTDVQFLVNARRVSEDLPERAGVHLLFDKDGRFLGAEVTHV